MPGGLPGGFYGASAKVSTPDVWIRPSGGQAAAPTGTTNFPNAPFIEAGPTRDCRPGRDCKLHPYVNYGDIYNGGFQTTDTRFDLVSGATYTYETIWSGNSTRWQAWFYDTTWHLLGQQDYELYTDQGMNYVASGGEATCLMCPIGRVRTEQNKYFGSGASDWSSWCYSSTQNNVDGDIFPDYSTCTAWTVYYNPRVYLPYIRDTWLDNTSSTVFIQNASSAAVDIITEIYRNDGTYLTGLGERLNGYGSTDVRPVNLGAFEGYAIVNGATRYLTAAARVRNSTMAGGYTGFRAAQGTHIPIPGSGEPGVGSYLPMVKKSWYGHTSYIHVVNVESVPVTVTINFWHAQGDPAVYGGDATWTDPALLQPGQSRTYDLHNISLPLGSGGRWLGSAVVGGTSSSPSPTTRYLAVLASDTADDQSQNEFFNAYSWGSGYDLYIPLVKNAWYGGTTGLAIMNWDPTYTANVSVIYYACYVPPGGSRDCTSYYTVGPLSIDPQRSYFLFSPSGLPPGFLGSARVVNNNGVPIAAISQDASTSDKGTEGHPGLFQGPQRSAALPVNMKNVNYDFDGYTWQSGIEVQNTGNTNISDLEVRYYNQSGTLLYTLHLPDAYPSGLGTVNPLLPGRSVSYYAPSGVPDGFLGSVVVEAMGQYDAIRAVTNLRSNKTSTTIDYSLGFGGYPR